MQGPQSVEDGAAYRPAALGGDGGAWRVWRVASTGSTQDDLRQYLVDAASVPATGAAAGGEPALTALVAGEQRRGRGRVGRRWESAPGAGVALTVEVPAPAVGPWLTLGAGVAVHRALAGLVAAPAPTLKWPNDVLFDDRKVAGILAERLLDGRALLGIGINVAAAPAVDQPTVALADLGVRVGPDAVVASVLAELDRLVRELVIGRTAHRARYRAVCTTLDRRVSVRLPDGRTLQGRAVDIDVDGRLLVQPHDADAVPVDAGDVTHVR